MLLPITTTTFELAQALKQSQWIPQKRRGRQPRSDKTSGIPPPATAENTDKAPAQGSNASDPLTAALPAPQDKEAANSKTQKQTQRSCCSLFCAGLFRFVIVK